MTSDNNIIDDKKRDNEDEALAAELALGVLTGTSRSDAEARALTDPQFFQLVKDWQARLGGLILTIPAVSPPDSLLPQLEARLFHASKPSSELLSLPAKGDVWRSLFFWRMTTLAGFLAALSVFMMMNPIINSSPIAPLVATLHGANAGPVFLAQFNPATNSLTIRPVATADDAAHDLELWLIPSDKVARSLGVLSKSGSTQVVIPEAMKSFAGPDSVLAITVEPLGGSPTGKATGPIIALGPLTKL